MIPAYNRLGMLLELVVENYAVVDRLRVRFHSGLNLLTGETGSGKSIVVDALGLLLGGRASAEMIRTGESRARVAGIFEVREQPAVRRLLDPAGLEIEDGELLIEREILAGGKSRAFVGSRPVAVSLLRELAPFLGDIHGQHDQQLIVFERGAARDAGRVRRQSRTAGRGGADLSGVAGRGRGAGGTGAHRAGEAAAAGPVELPAQGDRERRAAGRRRRALEDERRVLQNVQKLQESAGTAYEAVYEWPESAVALARMAAKRLDELCRIDPSLDGLREHLKAAELACRRRRMRCAIICRGWRRIRRGWKKSRTAWRRSSG